MLSPLAKSTWLHNMHDYSDKNGKTLAGHIYETSWNEKKKNNPNGLKRRHGTRHGDTDMATQTDVSYDVNRFPLTLASEETKQSYTKFMISVYLLYSVYVWVAKNYQSSEETCHKQPTVADYLSDIFARLRMKTENFAQFVQYQSKHNCQSDSSFNY